MCSTFLRQQFGMFFYFSYLINLISFDFKTVYKNHNFLQLVFDRSEPRSKMKNTLSLKGIIMVFMV